MLDIPFAHEKRQKMENEMKKREREQGEADGGMMRSCGGGDGAG